MRNTQPGSLYIVATPIGNLGDLSPRAQKTLEEVDYIAAEDTRHSARLLQHFSISTPMIAYHDHSNIQRQQQLFQLLEEGNHIALISDAGTPLISDPGYILVKQARDISIPVIPIPGPCAIIAALSASGLPTDRFIFEGFLPAKAGAREARLQTLATETRTLMFYESTHRILDSLHAMKACFGEARQAVIAREITKTYETILSGTLSTLCDTLEADHHQQKGEFVVLVHGCPPATHALDDNTIHTMKILLEELPLKQAAALGAKLTGLKKRELYQWGVDYKQD